MLVPVKFISDSISQGATDLLRFYLLLRWNGQKNAGYFNIKQIQHFSWRQRKTLLKELQRLGWIEGNKIISVYKLEELPIHASLLKKYLGSKKLFKGFCIAVFESYTLRNNYRINRRLNRTKQVNSSRHLDKVHKSSEEVYTGGIAKSYISKVLGISSATIARWRLHSLNKYKVYKRMADSHYAFTSGTCHYCDKLHYYVHYHMRITSQVFIYYAGKKHQENKGNLVSAGGVVTY